MMRSPVSGVPIGREGVWCAAFHLCLPLQQPSAGTLSPAPNGHENETCRPISETLRIMQETLPGSHTVFREQHGLRARRSALSKSLILRTRGCRVWLCRVVAQGVYSITAHCAGKSQYFRGQNRVKMTLNPVHYVELTPICRQHSRRTAT